MSARCSTDQITTLTSQKSTLGIGAILSILLALFSASGGMQNLMTAVNMAYDEEEKRSRDQEAPDRSRSDAGRHRVHGHRARPRRRPAALARTAPRWLLGSPTGSLLIGRWVLLAVLVAVALAVLYRVAPDRDAPKIRWVSVGAVMATVLWLLASVGFSLYVSRAGQLRQDLRRPGRHRRAAVLAVDHRLRRPARRRDQRRDRAADGQGHHQGARTSRSASATPSRPTRPRLRKRRPHGSR